MSRRNTGTRIALLIESDGAGGAERAVAQLAMELQDRGHSVVVFLPPRGEGWLERALAGSDVEVDHFWLDRPFDPGCARELAGSFRHHRIEIAHGHEFAMAFYGAWAARLAGIPHVITMHGRAYYADTIRRRLALRAAAMSSGALVSVSEALAQQLSTDLLLLRRRITVIPNGVRMTTVTDSTLRQEIGIPDRVPLVLSLGSLYPVKGHIHLLRAAAKLSSRYPELHVAIAGRGHLYDTLREQGRSLGLESRLHLLGLRTDVGNVLAGADVFAMPSLAEGLPLAVLEAMLSSRMIVASDVGDIGQVLAHGKAGVLVKPGDPDELAQGIDHLLSHPEEGRRMADYAARRANSEYRLERMTARYEVLYRTLLGQDTFTGIPEISGATLTT